jgi:hypothetical protein
MNNNLLQIKIKQRLNKLSTFDYSNIECWQIAEAFNKAQIQWVARQIQGINARNEGSESTLRKIDSLQKLLTVKELTGNTNDITYFETESLPLDYLDYKRISIKGKHKLCEEPRMFVVYLAQESDVDVLLTDSLSNPNFEWAETFCTIIGNKIKIYTDNQFDVIQPTLTYYRKPRNIQFINCVNLENGQTSTANVECELKDDVIEILIDEAASILAGDIESIMQYQRNAQSAEKNT